MSLPHYISVDGSHYYLQAEPGAPVFEGALVMAYRCHLLRFSHFTAQYVEAVQISTQRIIWGYLQVFTIFLQVLSVEEVVFCFHNARQTSTSSSVNGIDTRAMRSMLDVGMDWPVFEVFLLSNSFTWNLK